MILNKIVKDFEIFKGLSTESDNEDEALKVFGDQGD